MNALAYLFAILKGIIYGSTVFFTGQLLESTDVLDVLALRFLMSFAVMWLLKVIRVWKIEVSAKDFFVKNPRTPYIKSLLLAALFEPVLYMALETWGISMTSNVTAGVIISLSAISNCVVEMIVLKERSTWLQNIFLGLGIFGAIYIAVNGVSGGDGKDTALGVILLSLAMVSGSLYAAFSRKSSKVFRPMEITYVSAMLGAVAFNGVNVVRHLLEGDILHYFDPYFDWHNMIGFVVLAILSTIVATAMNNFALSRLQLSTMAAFGGLSTVVTIAVGVIFGGERLYRFHAIGLACILARMIGVSAISIHRDKVKQRLMERQASFEAEELGAEETEKSDSVVS